MEYTRNMWTTDSYISKILNIFFPSKCYGCRKRDTTLCEKCLQNCAKSIDTPEIYITSIYSFKDPLIKRAIHAIKYYHRRDLIAPLTEELAKTLLERINNNEKVSILDSQIGPDMTTPYTLHATRWILVPIPMPTLRKYLRGYNQAELIAKELSRECHINYNSTVLARSRSPKRQVKTFTRGERLQNQNKSFIVTSPVNGLNIILVDDVTTTGATIVEARKTLLKAGAKNVKAVTVAH